jgi:hypothetical protein
MSFTRGFLAARAHMAFLLGLAGALGLIYMLEHRKPEAVVAGFDDWEKALSMQEADAAAAPLQPTGVALTEFERERARIAWRYFENNYQPTTGLVNSVDKFPSATLWDLGSYAMALLAAEDLGLLEPAAFEDRLTRLLTALTDLPLVDGKLPNKAYDTRSGAMVDYANNPSPTGIGWSAIDIARMAVPLNLISWRHPTHTAAVSRILSKWSLPSLASRGQMQGATRRKAGLELVQEGRFGYEQYAAKSLFLLGTDVSRAVRYDLDVEVRRVEGQAIASDSRSPATHGGTHNAVLSEPYILEALEFGLNSTTRPLARAVYAAQVNRAQHTGKLVAASEDNLDRAPYFVYNTVLNGGVAWAAFTPDGADASAHRTFSVKAAMGWSYVFGGAYAEKLRAASAELVDPERGFYSGRYDADGTPNKAITANTNAVVLESLWYRLRGPLLSSARTVSELR